ncbi:BTAD domain-containing putative transcriptional regulator [Pseudonocardia sp.]|uniref:BTAD domain-containing putative transcriptional regulator n=1 Tax=Pseudonocardia sp. TaxID=60912 RepID=UPI0031FDD11C
MTTIAVLGPLALTGPDGPVRVGSGRQRRLLAALVARLGVAVPTDVLAELVWEDPATPADPSGAVQTNVARLRRVLPPGTRIDTTPEGYRLVADRRDVDVAAFTDLLGPVPGEDPPRRLARLDEALRLWRGGPYPELDHPSVEPEVARLCALRAGAVEDQARALLEVGRAAEAVAALEALVATEPLREEAVAGLMRALVASGRQGDALGAYTRLRTRLADELGLDPSPELRELERQVLNQEVPAPHVIGGGPVVRLPVSSFVGRTEELAAGADLLGRCRVVTLCGPGGAGKTRLARHLAAGIADRYEDVVVVELGKGGPQDVEPSIAAALRLASPGSGTGDTALLDRIVEVLAVRRALLVVDNCEHVADELAPLVEAVCAGAPRVDLLLTSREALRVDGEQVLPVAPLPPGPAARLLVDRIRAADPAAVLAPELVAEACRRLDGLPLALELAAARAGALGLGALVDALEHPLEVLHGGRRTADPRHRSLRDVVAWSYGLLDDEQRRLFEQMSVFAGAVEREAVAAVCDDSAALPDLVGRSLVVRSGEDPAGFGMLETLRAFARARCAAGPAGPALRARHARWAVRLAEEILRARETPDEASAVRRFDAHLPELRSAHDRLCRAGLVEDVLRLGVLFGELGWLRGRADLVRLTEESLRVAGVLGRDGTVAGHAGDAAPLAARVLGLLATACWQRGDLDLGEAYSRHAVQIAVAGGDPLAARYGHEPLANVLSFRGDLAGSMREAATAEHLARKAGDGPTLTLSLFDLALGSAYSGDRAAASRYERELDAVVGPADPPTRRGFAAYVRGELRAEAGDPGAADHLREAAATVAEADSRFIEGVARHTLLTSGMRDSADPAGRLAALWPLIEHWHRFGAWMHLWVAMRALVETLSRLDRHAEVAELLGARRASARATVSFGTDLERERAVERAARAALGPEFEARLAVGAALGDAEALALARRITLGPGREAPAGPEPTAT